METNSLGEWSYTTSEIHMRVYGRMGIYKPQRKATMVTGDYTNMLEEVMQEGGMVPVISRSELMK